MEFTAALTLADVLPAAARAYGKATALISDDKTFSFWELDQLSNRLAAALVGLGVKTNDRVTLYSPNCWEWVVSYYAIAKVGGVSNPINMMLTPEEVLFIVGDCGAKAILTSRGKGMALLDVKGASPLEKIVMFGDDTPRGAYSFDELIRESRPHASNGASAADSLASIMYTSGTTGYPKGAMLTHTNLLFNGAMTANVHLRTAADTIVTALPMPHVYGGAILNSSMLCGATLVLLARFEERAALDAIACHRATMFEGVPTMYMYLLNSGALATHDLSSLTRCTVGGQTMPVAKMEEVEQRFGCRLIELWGMTELAGLGTTHPMHAPGRLGSIGIPLPGVESRVAETSNPKANVSVDDVGELMVRGPIVMQGYYGNPQATRETIECDGWLHTGDLARMDADGYVYIVDRMKDMIITAGFKVFPAEIERVLAQHPSVAMVAVGSTPDTFKGEIAKAYVVLTEGHSGDESTLLSFCREHLAAYKVPRAVKFVRDLPKTSTGKIMRRQLKTLDDAVVPG